MESLNLKRLGILMLNELRLPKKIIWISVGVLALFFILTPISVTGYSDGYLHTLYLGGFIITSFAFNDLHDKRRACFLLTLPCSSLERFLSKWLLTSIGYAIALLILYYLFSMISALLYYAILHTPIYLFNVFQSYLWIAIGKYIILQSIVLLGAAVFKKYTLIKTALTLGCLILLFSLITGIIIWMFCPPCIANGFFIHNIFTGSHFIFWIVIAPLCWYVTYLRITEYELK